MLLQCLLKKSAMSMSKAQLMIKGRAVKGNRRTKLVVLLVLVMLMFKEVPASISSLVVQRSNNTASEA